MTDRIDRTTARTRRTPGAMSAAGPGPMPWREAARALLRRRQVPGDARRRAPSPPFPDYLERATCSSFQMDGVSLTQAEFRAAMASRAAAGAHRSRSAQRVRNHVAILRRVESLLRRAQPLQPAEVIRWYTSLASGLSAGGIGAGTVGRIERIVSAVNSPRLRFWPAVQEVAALHVNLLTDPFVPGFNGILARLLLRYHMGRCGLPPVAFDPVTDPPRLASVTALESRLLELIVANYEGSGGV